MKLSKSFTGSFAHLPSFLNWYLLFASAFLVPSLVGVVLIRTIALRDTFTSLKEITQRVKHDLSFHEGKWDTSLYNSDPLTAYPNSSSASPLYIVTTDGFVIERSKPIGGLLDTSDFKHLMQFQTPQDILTVTNEHWRVLSKPVVREGKTYGVIMVALYSPTESSKGMDDKQLQENSEKLDAFLSVKDGDLDASKVDVRNIQYLVSFEIVDKFNKVLVNDGRIPTFIDPSYVEKEFNQKHPRVIQDERTHAEHLVFSEPILDKDGNHIALVVAGQSTQSLKDTLREYLLIAVVASLLVPVPLCLVALHVFENYIQKRIRKIEESLQEKKIPTTIFFDKKLSVLHIDGEKIEIVYASNQYYLCKAIFSAPKKRWEQDELIEQMGDTATSEKYRKIYDASLAVNKKSGFKLVLYQDKTYLFNPDFHTALISKSVTHS